MSEEKSFDLESRMYALYELRTKLRDGIDNYNKIIAQYEIIIDVVEKSDRRKEIPDDFVTGFNEEKMKMKQAIPEMEKRVSYLSMLIDRYEKKDADGQNVDQIVTLLFNALGINTEGSDVKPAEKKDNA
jgi:hypothetical protein